MTYQELIDIIEEIKLVEEDLYKQLAEAYQQSEEQDDERL